MRAIVLFPILLFASLFAGTLAADASPIFPQALCDSELAAESAGRSVTLHLEARAEIMPPMAMAMNDPAPGLFGLQTLIFDSGTASVSQAVTTLSLQATLNGLRGF